MDFYLRRLQRNEQVDERLDRLYKYVIDSWQYIIKEFTATLGCEEKKNERITQRERERNRDTRRAALEKKTNTFLKKALGPWFSSIISRPAPKKHPRALLAHPSSENVIIL